MQEKRRLYSVPKTNWLWLKIGFLTVIVSTMIGLLSVEAEVDKPLTNTCDLSGVEMQYNYILKGINIINSPVSMDKTSVVESTLDLVLSLKETDNCLNIQSIEEVEKVKLVLNTENLGLRELSNLINTRVNQLNKKNLLVPLPNIVVGNLNSDRVEIPENTLQLDNLETESEQTCSSENKILLEELITSIKSDEDVLSQKSMMFLNALVVKNKLEVIVPDVVDKQYGLLAVENLKSTLKCQFNVEKYTDEDTNSNKEFLCPDGEVVVDKLLCALD